MAAHTGKYIQGVRLGGGNGVTFPQSEAQAIPAERITYRYHCHQGHFWDIPLATEVTPPESWDCPRCGDHGHRESAQVRDAARLARRVEQEKEMARLRERRTDAELQELLNEALKLYRRQGYTFGTTGLSAAASTA